jgi:hypothetical protein
MVFAVFCDIIAADAGLDYNGFYDEEYRNDSFSETNLESM